MGARQLTGEHAWLARVLPAHVWRTIAPHVTEERPAATSLVLPGTRLFVPVGGEGPVPAWTIAGTTVTVATVEALLGAAP